MPIASVEIFLFPETGLQRRTAVGCSAHVHKHRLHRQSIWMGKNASLNIISTKKQMWLESSQLVVPWWLITWARYLRHIKEEQKWTAAIICKTNCSIMFCRMIGVKHATAWRLDIREVSGVEMAYRRQFPFTIHKISEDIHVQTLEKKVLWYLMYSEYSWIFTIH